MKVSDNLNINTGKINKGKKHKAGQPSPFGQDEVKLGNKPDKKMGLTRSQINNFFATQGKDIVSEARWESAKTGLTNTNHHYIITGKDGSVYVKAEKGINKLDPGTGAALWTAELPITDQAVTMTEAGDGTVVGAGDDNKLHGFDPKTGKETWSFDLGNKFENPMMTDENGDVLTFRKDGENLHLTRLNSDGSVKSDAVLGGWNKPLIDGPFKGEFINREKNGDMIIHAPLYEPDDTGDNKPHMRNTTMRVTPDGKVLWKTNNLDPAASFDSDPDHFFMVSYDRMGVYDKNTGKEIVMKKKKQEHIDPDTGRGYGDTRFEIGGQHKYKYLKFFGAKNDRVFIQAYSEGPLRTTKSGEEVLCVDANNLDTIYWKKDSWSSAFNGPLYSDDKVIVHIQDEDKGIIEGLDPKTGNSKWAVALTTGQSAEGRPSHYMSQKGKDGNLYIRTFNNIYGIDTDTGKIKYTIKSKNPLRTFRINDNTDTVFAINNENFAVQAYEVSTPDQITAGVAEKIAGKGDTPPVVQDLSIKVEETQVNIGGVVLKKNK